MGTENKETTPTTPAAGTPDATTPPASSVTQPEPKAKATPPSADPTPPLAAAGAGAAPSSKAKEKDDDDDDSGEPHPDDHGIVRLPLTAFLSRVKRSTKRELKELFGTDDRNELLLMKQELDSRRAKDEEVRKQSLAEIDRIREEAAQEKTKREAAEQRAAALEERQQASEEDTRIRVIADKYVKPKFYKHVARDLAEHLSEEYGEDVNDVTYAQIDAWLADYAKENPEMAVAPPAADPNPDKKAGITNGPQGQRPAAPPSGGQSGKTFKPGQPNSMSREEFAAYKRQQGWNF